MQKNILITVLFLDTTVIRKNILTFMLFFVSEIMTVNALISGKKIYGNSYRFCEELKLKGYDVKATHKQQHGLNQSVKDAHNTAPKKTERYL